ncbi:MAG: hypothetical protein K8R58_00850 [Bacteroidales bacterium]|nr:hypothetical protein [Bacteroidales bacterium]
MNTTQIESQILQHTKGLPLDVLQEILDFIQFVKVKKIKKSSLDNLKKELSILDQSEAKHLEEEFINYKELYPNED